MAAVQYRPDGALGIIRQWLHSSDVDVESQHLTVIA